MCKANVSLCFSSIMSGRARALHLLERRQINCWSPSGSERPSFPLRFTLVGFALKSSTLTRLVFPRCFPSRFDSLLPGASRYAFLPPSLTSFCAPECVWTWPGRAIHVNSAPKIVWAGIKTALTSYFMSQRSCICVHMQSTHRCAQSRFFSCEWHMKTMINSAGVFLIHSASD